MFVIYYQSPGHPARYFCPEKDLQKTIKTAFLMPEKWRSEFETAATKNPTMHIKTIDVSPLVEMMYPNGIQKNKIRW